MLSHFCNHPERIGKVKYLIPVMADKCNSYEENMLPTDVPPG